MGVNRVGKFLSIWLTLVMLLPLGVIAVQSDASTTISGNTIALVNLRSGPGTSYGVVAILDSQTPVNFTGRNASSTWLQADAQGNVGWLFYIFVNVEGNVMHLPVVDADAPTSAATPSAPAGRDETPSEAAVPPVDAPVAVVPAISGTAREIFLRGLELGNRPDVFSKVGDSITASNLFLDPIGNGGLVLDQYAYLQPVVDYFSQTPAGDHFSFANTSVAARSGWTAHDLLDPDRASTDVCVAGESPLMCEYRLTRPAVALIMLGTNDIGWVDPAVYETNLRQIVQISIDSGVIPVISTIPDQFGTYGGGRVGQFNDIIRQVAADYGIPLWDYWLAMQPLPESGLGGDGIHPSYDPHTGETGLFTADGLRYGYNMRNLTALMVLDAVWRGALY